MIYKAKHPFDKPYSPQDAQKIWNKLVSKGYTPELDPGNPGSRFWKGPHINVNVDGTDVHIPADPDLKK